jgi:hypothetical protein
MPLPFPPSFVPLLLPPSPSSLASRFSLHVLLGSVMGHTWLNQASCEASSRAAAISACRSFCSRHRWGLLSPLGHQRGFGTPFVTIAAASPSAPDFRSELVTLFFPWALLLPPGLISLLGTPLASLNASRLTSCCQRVHAHQCMCVLCTMAPQPLGPRQSTPVLASTSDCCRSVPRHFSLAHVAHSHESLRATCTAWTRSSQPFLPLSPFPQSFPVLSHVGPWQHCHASLADSCVLQPPRA